MTHDETTKGQQVIHLMINASSVRCGQRMRRSDETNTVNGWDMGNTTVDPFKATCPNCILSKAVAR